MAHAERLLLGILLGSLILAGLSASSAEETTQGGRLSKTCTLLADNAAKVQQLLRRMEGFHKAYIEEQWKDLPSFVYAYPDEEEKRGVTKYAKLIGKHTKFLEWHPLRILQCGSVAMEMSRDLTRDAGVAKGEHVDIPIGFVFWSWQDGDWYADGASGHFGRRPLNWNLQTQEVWLDEPHEPFVEVWVAPSEIPHGIELEAEKPLREKGSEAGPSSPDPQSPPIPHATSASEDEYERVLQESICVYHRAVLDGAEERIASFWASLRKKSVEAQDEVYRTVRVAAEGASFESFRIDRIQVDLGQARRVARVDASYYVVRRDTSGKERKERIRTTTSWLRRGSGWVRTPPADEADARNWRKEDLRVKICPSELFRNIVVREPVPTP